MTNDDSIRVERMARGLVAAEGLDPDYRITAEHGPLWTYSQGTARAAMALADAERAAEAQSQFAKDVAEFDHEHAETKQRMDERRAEMRGAIRGPTKRFKL